MLTTFIVKYVIFAVLSVTSLVGMTKMCLQCEGKKRWHMASLTGVLAVVLAVIFFWWFMYYHTLYALNAH